MKIYLKIVFAIMLTGAASAQTEGEISFISSQHYYVRFNTKNNCSEGDTLYSADNNAVLLINYISERSCACIALGDKELKLNQKVHGINKNKIDQKIINTSAHNNADILQVKTNIIDPVREKVQVVSGRIESPLIYNTRLSIQNYSTYSNISADIQRSRYTLSGRLGKILESFTISTFLNYSKDEGFYSFRGEKRINVYDLNVNYNSGNTINLWLGRYLNPRISSLSTIDGLQSEIKMNKYFTGLLIGSRPGFNDFGYNIKLLEYGAYAGRTDTIADGYMENTAAIFQQTNNSAIDRRFLYFQHQNNILGNLNLFLSSEIDLYSREKGKGQNSLTATSIYFNSRYAPVKSFSVSLSYDARKNVIYYETFKNIADSILDKETRQGLRLGINVRPFSYSSFGLNGGYRYKKGDTKPSRNFGGYFSYSSIPLIKASGSLNFSILSTGYLNGINYGVYIAKDLFTYISFQINLRRVEYSFRTYKMDQNIIASDISFKLSKIIFFMAGYEAAFERKSTYQRILADITARF